MTELTIALMLVASLLTMLDWRKGLILCVLVGVAQDPLRKMAPGQPLYYVLLAAAIFGITWVRAGLKRIPLGPSAIYGWRKELRTPFVVFTVLVCIQAALSFARYGSFLMPAIGMAVWLAPIPAVVLGYQYANRRGSEGVRQLMVIYIAAALLALSGVYFEYAGFGWRTLGEIGEGQIIYDLGTVLKAHSGFFRASEIAAWHTAAMACFIFILSIGKRPTVLRIAAAIAIVIVLVGLGILTGRRKMLVEIMIFICTYGFLVAWLQRGLARLAMVILAMAIVGYVGVVGFVAPDLVQGSYSKSMHMADASRLQNYAERGKSVVADLPARFATVGIRPVVDAIEEFGWFGAGLGSGSQGTNQIAEEHGINRYAAEGGLGKIAMELGVPGIFVLLWLGVAFTRHLRNQLAYVTAVSPPHTRLAFGLLAFLIANAATFSVATQAYSDPFILLILGWCLGFLLAMPVLAEQRLIEQEDALGFADTEGDHPITEAPSTLGAALRDR